MPNRARLTKRLGLPTRALQLNVFVSRAAYRAGRARAAKKIKISDSGSAKLALAELSSTTHKHTHTD